LSEVKLDRPEDKVADGAIAPKNKSQRRKEGTGWFKIKTLPL
jgi:hypothetical protein